MGGFRHRTITMTLACSALRASGGVRPASHHIITSTVQGNVLNLVSIQDSNMSTAELGYPVFAARRSISGGLLSMQKSRACRRLFEPDDQDDIQEMDPSYSNSVEEQLRVQREEQSRRWGFDFRRGVPREDSRLCWDAVAEETVPSIYRESRPRAPLMRNPRRRARWSPILSARTSESTDQDTSGSSSDVTGQVNGSQTSSAQTGPMAVELAKRLESMAGPLDNNTRGNTVEKDDSSRSNGISDSTSKSLNATTSSEIRLVQSNMQDHFPVRKRSRSSSESSDQTKRRRFSPASEDRPRSAPATVVTLS